MFQIHLWSGIGLGLYVLFISVTGSVLVYANELRVVATHEPTVSHGSRRVLSDAELTELARRSHPGYEVATILRPSSSEQAVEVWLKLGDETRKRFFDPRSGADVGSASRTALRFIEWLIELHDELLGGSTGRHINGFGALALLLLAFSGAVIWWPGVARWRRSLTLHRGVGWKRFTWDLHSAMGFWVLAFVLVFGFSGLYLCFPDRFQSFVDWLEPLTDENAGKRWVDDALYWLAYFHFGRINGIGIPCSGPGACDQLTKAAWAIAGLAPAAMFVTGAIMWWNRVVRRELRRNDG